MVMDGNVSDNDKRKARRKGYGLKTGIDFEHFGLKLGMVIGGTFTKAYNLIFLPSDRGE